MYNERYFNPNKSQKRSTNWSWLTGADSSSWEQSWITRCHASKLLREKCCYCQEDTAQLLRLCSSSIRGKMFTEIVNISGNQIWKVLLGDNFLGFTCKRYYASSFICYIHNWEKFVQHPKHKGNPDCQLVFWSQKRGWSQNYSSRNRIYQNFAAEN